MQQTQNRVDHRGKNLLLLRVVAHRGLDRLEVPGRPILVGLSRKRTLGSLTGRDVENRLPAGIAAAVLAFERGASIIRTHDVAETVDALRIAAAVLEAQTSATGDTGKSTE